MNIVAHMRRGADLTLVDSSVAMLRILDLQSPVFGMRMMDGPEALVTGVRVATDGEEMHVPMSHPGHLQRHLQINRPTGRWRCSRQQTCGGGRLLCDEGMGCDCFIYLIRIVRLCKIRSSTNCRSTDNFLII